MVLRRCSCDPGRRDCRSRRTDTYIVAWYYPNTAVPNSDPAMLNDVYNRRIIEFAANIPRIGRLASPDASATAHSRLCGSTVTVDVKMDGDKVTDFAHDVKACALGQASSSIMASHVIGSSAEELRALREGVRKMLKENGALRPRANGPISPCSNRCATTRRGTPRRFSPLTPWLTPSARSRRNARPKPRSDADVRRAVVDLLRLFDASRSAPRLAGRGLIKAYQYTLSPLVGFAAATCRPARTMPTRRSIDTACGPAAGWRWCASYAAILGHIRRRFRARRRCRRNRLVYAVALRALAWDRTPSRRHHRTGRKRPAPKVIHAYLRSSAGVSRRRKTWSP